MAISVFRFGLLLATISLGVSGLVCAGGGFSDSKGGEGVQIPPTRVLTWLEQSDDVDSEVHGELANSLSHGLRFGRDVSRSFEVRSLLRIGLKPVYDEFPRKDVTPNKLFKVKLVGSQWGELDFAFRCSFSKASFMQARYACKRVS